MRPTREETSELRQALARTPLSEDAIDRISRRGYMLFAEVDECLRVPRGTLCSALYQKLQPLRGEGDRIYTPRRFDPWDVLEWRRGRLLREAARRGDAVASSEIDPGIVRQIVVRT